MRSIYENDLPDVLMEIKNLIGWEAALKLVETYGGLHLDVPRTVRDDHALVRLLGRRAAEKFILQYGGTKPYIAKLDAAMRVARNMEIVEKYQLAGVPVKKLARDYGLTERWIWDILARSGDQHEDSRQITLPL